MTSSNLAAFTTLPLALLGMGLISTSACTTTGTVLSEEEEEKLSIAAQGRWAIPPEILAMGDEQDVPYTSAGPWRGTSSCSGGMKTGTRQLRDYVNANFPQVSLIGGYACRRIVGSSSRMSVHGTGRALDIHIPTINGAADNEAGDAIGNWLIANAEEMGIQYIIWDRTQWTANRADGTKARRYNGAHPHHDHLHVELSVAGGAANTPWYSGPKLPPHTPACEAIAATGGEIGTNSLCLHLNGPSRFWRNVSGEGHEGDLLWTNAFRSSSPSNWAQWELHFETAGDYEVEVFLDPDYAKYERTRYRVRHGGQSEDVEFDQSSSTGWSSLGVFSFSDSGTQNISVYDNTSTSPGGNRSIMVDAVRLTPVTN